MKSRWEGMAEVLIFTAVSLQQEQDVEGVHRMEEPLGTRHLKGAFFWLVHTSPGHRVLVLPLHGLLQTYQPALPHPLIRPDENWL